jgi:hypothetical protein
VDTENPQTPDDVWEPPAQPGATGGHARPAGRRIAAKTAALVAAGLLVGGGVVFAAVHKSGSSAGSNAAAAGTANGAIAGAQGFQGGPAGGGGVAGEQHIQGTVTAKTSGSITVKSSSGAATYVVNATTEIVRNGQQATLSAVKVGDAVFVHVYPSSSGRMLVERLFAGTSATSPAVGPPGGAPTTTGTAPVTGSPTSVTG